MKNLTTAIASLIALVFFVTSAVAALQLPTKEISRTTKQCVRVMDYKGNVIPNGCHNDYDRYSTLIVY